MTGSTKVKTVIDIHQGRAIIQWKGHRWIIPIDIHKGIKPKRIEEEEENAYLTQDVKIRYKKVHPKAPRPEQKTEDAAGFDLITTEEVEIPPCEIAIINTGVAVEIPKGHVGLIKSRSSLAKAGLGTEGGVIDADYIGEIKIIMANRSKFKSMKLRSEERRVGKE